MDKLIIETPAAWLQAQKIKLVEKLPPLYVKEEIVYEFYKWSSRKARLGGIVIGMAISVGIAGIIKLAGL